MSLCPNLQVLLGNRASPATSGPEGQRIQRFVHLPLDQLTSSLRQGTEHILVDVCLGPLRRAWGHFQC